MKTRKQRQTVRQIEMVETYNIANSFRRIRAEAAGYDNQRIKRVLYHALLMQGNLTIAEQTNFRVALNLP